MTEETIMADKAYEYMDWPRIEAIVYGEEAAPRDVMQPRVTEDGVLIQGFFPGTEAAEVLVGKKVYPMTLEDEAGYYAVMIPLKRIPEYRFRVTRGNMKETFYDAYECPCQITEEEEKAFCNSMGIYGNRADCLCQMIHASILSQPAMADFMKSYSISSIHLSGQEAVRISTPAPGFYGKTLAYTYHTACQTTTAGKG